MAINTYIKETISEMKHVSWPTRKQAMLFTVLVIVISIVISAYVGALDAFFVRLLSLFLSV